MIERHQNGTCVRATFRIPTGSAERVDVLGDFTDWLPLPMQRHDDSFGVSVDLQIGKQYRFRYLLDGDRWENDWAADAYVPNEYGGDDSLIDLRQFSSESTDEPPSPGDVPNEAEAEREFGVTDDGRSLAERGELVDEQGDDIRQYTGEPVATEHGYVIPQQSPSGDNAVGGGEWPNEPDRGDSIEPDLGARATDDTAGSTYVSTDEIDTTEGEQ